MDYLAQTALSAIETARPDMASWVADKRHELAGKDRLEVLRWVGLSLDGQNRRIVAQALGVSAADLDATARVLKAV